MAKNKADRINLGTTAVIDRATLGTPTYSEPVSRLSVVPLVTLLPEMGDVRALRESLSIFEERLAELQASKDEFEGEEARLRQSEESMLHQVIQWLSLGSNR